MTRHESDNNGVDLRVDHLLRQAGGVAVERDAEFLRRLRSESADAFAAAAEGSSDVVDAGAGGHMAPRHLEPAPSRSVRRWPLRAALAAAAAVVLGLALWALHSGSPAYAFAAVPDGIRKARTLHWVETEVNGYGTPADRKLQTIKKEVWLDAEKGLHRNRYTDDVPGEDGRLLNDGESCRGQEFVTVISHARRSVFHARVNRLVSLVEARESRRDLLRHSGLGDPATLQSFEKTGREDVKGVRCDVWTGRVPQPSSSDLLVTAWIAARDGTLRKLHTRAADEGSVNFISRTVEVVEVDAKMPAEFFRLDAPEGYEVAVAREAAPVEEFNRGFGGGKYRLCLMFTLPGGAVIACWNNSPSDRNANAAAFEGLKPGGPVPHLPTVLAALRTNGAPGGEIEFAGRHLAVTRSKEGNVFEWTLLVPVRPAPLRHQFFGYTLEFGLPEGAGGHRHKADYHLDVPVESREDFDTFVRGAMAQYSADAAVPDHVQLEQVTALAEQVRKAVQEDPGQPLIPVTPSGL